MCVLTFEENKKPKAKYAIIRLLGSVVRQSWLESKICLLHAIWANLLTSLKLSLLIIEYEIILVPGCSGWESEMLSNLWKHLISFTELAMGDFNIRCCYGSIALIPIVITTPSSLFVEGVFCNPLHLNL